MVGGMSAFYCFRKLIDISFRCRHHLHHKCHTKNWWRRLNPSQWKTCTGDITLKKTKIISFLHCKSSGVVRLLLVKWINNELKLEESGTQPPEQEKLNCFKDNLSLVWMDYNSRYLLFNRNFFNLFWPNLTSF